MSILTRFEEFRRKAEIQIESSKWLMDESSKIANECDYYDAHPYLDTRQKAEKRLAKIEQIEKRLRWEDRIQRNLVEEYKDIM